MPDLICLVAAFVAEDPAAAGATERELVEAIAELWPELPVEDIEHAFGIAGTLQAARLAAPKTKEQALIDRTRLFHGARAASELIFKYGLHRTAQRSDHGVQPDACATFAERWSA